MTSIFVALITIGLISGGALAQSHNPNHVNFNQNFNQNYNFDNKHYNPNCASSAGVDDAFIDDLLMGFLFEALNDPNFDKNLQPNPSPVSAISGSPLPPQPQSYDQDPSLLLDVQHFCRENPQLCAQLGLTDEFFRTQIGNGGYYVCPTCGQWPCKCQNQKGGKVCPVTGEYPCWCHEKDQQQRPDSNESNRVKSSMSSSKYDSSFSSGSCTSSGSSGSYSGSGGSYSGNSGSCSSSGSSYESVSQEVDCTKESWNPNFWTLSQRPRAQRPGLDLRSSLFKENPTVISPDFMKAMLRILKTRRGSGLLKLFQNKSRAGSASSYRT